MENRRWVETVEENVQRFGDLVVGIDPFLPDIPQVLLQAEDAERRISRYVDFILDIRSRIIQDQALIMINI